MTEITSVRVDKWLWAARFFKTRQLAVKAIKGGKVTLNNQRAKPAANLKVGDQLNVRRGPYQQTIDVLALSQQRGSASIAQTLYQETPESLALGEQVKQQLATQPRNRFGGHKPDKHTVRANRTLKRGE